MNTGKKKDLRENSKPTTDATIECSVLENDALNSKAIKKKVYQAPILRFEGEWDAVTMGDPGSPIGGVFG